MTRIVDFFKGIINGYFKICGFAINGIEWFFITIAKGIWYGIRFASVLLNRYVLIHIYTFVISPIYRFIIYNIYKYFIRFIIMGIVWIYRTVIVNIGRFILFLFKYPPLSWIKRFILYPLYKVTLKPLFTRHQNGRRGLTMEQKKAATGYAFTSPFIVGLLGLVLYPLGRIIYMSFNNVIQYQTEFTYQWVGIENFRRILQVDIDFVLEVQNFIVRVLLFTPVIITLAIIIAMLLNQSIKGKGFFRMIFFLPIIILNGELLANMSEYGGMDINLSFFVIDVITTIVPEFALDLFMELFGIIIEILWYTGVPILIFLAMLQKVDKSLYEAASIDGANSWSMFWKITLPIISPAITVSIIFIVVFLGNFDGNPINGIINDSRTAFDRREGYASAMALIYTFVQILVITILLFISNGQLRRTLLGKNRKKKLLSKSQKLALESKGA
ncbi:Lactose transport system permease protein LacF [Candidatus Izimaplasma bacterium HR1]|jgi:ABC-type sugar transport system permease subunit|uniref:carbohydrate ABC transporter permease n=1 Tax=Candidatus Izimoplasma sp. HR1 TaxID=1541959 RepID=UPI0004F7228A|nr:Lactose transport system permease protein LacF [Candidatus Izimaplasma bacterium HR1]